MDRTARRRLGIVTNSIKEGTAVDNPYQVDGRQRYARHTTIVATAGNRRYRKNRRFAAKNLYAEDKLTGIFATRAEYRPNPIGLSTCKIKAVDHDRGIVKIFNIDAFDNTLILDIKGYFPICDRVQFARIPEWLDGWGEWMPDEGLSFFEEAE